MVAQRCGFFSDLLTKSGIGKVEEEFSRRTRSSGNSISLRKQECFKNVIKILSSCSIYT